MLSNASDDSSRFSESQCSSNGNQDRNAFPSPKCSLKQINNKAYLKDLPVRVLYAIAESNQFTKTEMKKLLNKLYGHIGLSLNNLKESKNSVAYKKEKRRLIRIYRSTCSKQPDDLDAFKPFLSDAETLRGMNTANLVSLKFLIRGHPEAGVDAETTSVLEQELNVRINRKILVDKFLAQHPTAFPKGASAAGCKNTVGGPSPNTPSPRLAGSERTAPYF